jgi:hypothetical protein
MKKIPPSPFQEKEKHHRISVLEAEQKKKVKKNYVTIFFSYKRNYYG